MKDKNKNSITVLLEKKQKEGTEKVMYEMCVFSNYFKEENMVSDVWNEFSSFFFLSFINYNLIVY